MLSKLNLFCSVIDMLKSKTCGGAGDYQFLPQFASNSKLKVGSDPFH